MQEIQFCSLGWEDSLEKEMATHSSILAWVIPWTEEPGRLQSTASQESQTRPSKQQQRNKIPFSDGNEPMVAAHNIVDKSHMLDIEQQIQRVYTRPRYTKQKRGKIHFW